uniref:CCD97-like C-terminal domain-containing protein n=1 Tax=Plectus sambesii TaxID=2011161 RepID=A0A914VCX1_9BILA
MEEDCCEREASSAEPAVAGCSSSGASVAVNAMFRRVIGHREAYFRSEQLGSPDLTDDEKRTLLAELFATKPAVFLERYWQFLEHSDRDCFSHLAHDYDIGYYLRLLAPDRRGRTSGRTKMIANRRYAALRQLVADGDYFSDEEMRQREPLLYDQMVGQYLSELEKSRMMPKTERSGTLVGLFADFADTQRTALRRKEEETFEDHASRREKLLRQARSRRRTGELDGQRNGAVSDEEEEEEEEELSDDEEEGDANEVAFPATVSDEEKAQLRAEYISHMHERFLAGKDEEFVDYSDIDSNTRNDPIDLMQRDAEDDYFDSEPPTNVKEE